MDEENNVNGQTLEEMQEQEESSLSNINRNGSNGKASTETKNTKKNAIINKKIRKAILKAAMPAISTILIVATAAVVVLGIFNAVGDAIQSAVAEIKDFFTVDYENGGTIDIKDEAIDKIIEGIESLGVSIDDLKLMGEKADYNDPEVQEKNKEALRKYIRKFYEAQVITQTLYPNPSFFEKLSGKTYGTVYVQRTKGKDEDLSKVEQLEYISYEKMKEEVEKQNLEMKNKFSVDEDDKLVIVGSTQTIVKKDGKETENKTVLSMSRIDYKSVVSQYTTPMNFLVYLTLITQNPEFASAVVDLIKDSNIKITLMDNVSTSYTHEERTYTLHTKTKYEVEDVSYADDDINKEHPQVSTSIETSTTAEKKTEITDTTRITTTPVPAITYAKTWFSEQTVEYAKKDEPMQGSSYDTDQIDEEEPDLPGLGSVSWITNDITAVTTSGNVKKYEETVRGNVIDKTGEKGDGKKSFIGLLDVKFKLPNSSYREAAGENLVSGAEMFFHLLQKDSGTQNLESIMRYILYKYTGKSYGVTEFDFNIFDIRSFKSTSGSKIGLANYLRQFSHTGEAAQSPDGNYYKLYGDGVGWPTIGNADLQWKSHASKFDVPGKVLENGVEKEVPSIRNYVNGFLKKGETEQYSDDEISRMNIYIEKSIVDEIGNGVQSVYYNAVENLTENLNLSKQQLYALTALYYNRPAYLTEKINGRTFLETYSQATALYDINSWEHNKYIWDNWWAYLGGGAAGHIPARDASFETYVKGVYDFSKSDAGTVFGRKYYIYYTQAQLNRYSYAPKKNITRTTANEEEIFTYVQGSGNLVEAAYEVADHFMNSGVVVYYAADSVASVKKKNGRSVIEHDIQASWDKPISNPERYGVVCATYVTLSLWQAGLIDEDTINGIQGHYNACQGVEEILTATSYANEWERINSFDELQEGDIVINQGYSHTYIYLDGGKRLDQDYCIWFDITGYDNRGNIGNANRGSFMVGYRYVGK